MFDRDRCRCSHQLETGQMWEQGCSHKVFYSVCQIRKLPTSCFNRAACCSRSAQARSVDCRFSTPS